MFVVLDTNHLRELQLNTVAGQRLEQRVEERDASVFTSIVVAEESLQGWLAFIRSKKSGLEQLDGYARLAGCLETLQKLTVLPFDHEAAVVFHRLESQRLRVGTMDLKIASICIAHDALLLSRNLVDFQRIPQLRVENWLD